MPTDQNRGRLQKIEKFQGIPAIVKCYSKYELMLLGAVYTRPLDITADTIFSSSLDVVVNILHELEYLECEHLIYRRQGLTSAAGCEC